MGDVKRNDRQIVRIDDNDIDLLWTALRKADRFLTAEDNVALGGIGISLTEYAALMGLSGQQGRSAADMARCLSVSSQAAHNIVTKLERRGLVRRDPDEYSDVILVNRLTKKGNYLFCRADAALDLLEATRSRRIGEPVHGDLLNALEPAVMFGERTEGGIDSTDEKNRLVLASHLGSAVRNIQRQMMYAATDALRRTGTGLAISQALVLGHMVRGHELPVQKVADELGMPQQTVSYAMAALAGQKLVEGRTAPRHQRLKIYKLTDRGGSAARVCSCAVTDSIRSIVEQLDGPLDKITHALTKVTAVDGRAD
ncbi:MAG: MarR family transcriptional regulator [Bifidobacteriales bacterium]|nr:MarR family transcriptional regulator [Bifidobacteriales bacterium]